MNPEVMPWDEFYRWFKWNQGEHVSLIGPTHCGKTTLAASILDKRGFVVTFGTKPADETLMGFIRSGWQRIGTWDDKPDLIKGAGRPPDQRIVLWPRYKVKADQKRHAGIFRDAMEEMFVEGHWTVFVDELTYISRILGMSDELTRWWLQGRSIKLTLVGATQRPVWVPPEMYTQAEHLFLWAANDDRDLKRLADIGGPLSGRELAEHVKRLDFHRHEVLYVNVRKGESVVTIPPER